MSPKKALRSLRASFFTSAGRALSAADTTRYALRYMLNDEYVASLGHTRFVSSRGILHACDIHCSKPASSKHWLPDLTHLASDRGASHVTIYVCSSALDEFARYIYDIFGCRPFTLVTGDSDDTVGGAESRAACHAILSHPSLVKWYSQNLSMDHAKLRHLPIGLDYHSAWNSPAFFGAGLSLPLHQEAEMLAVARASNPLLLRKLAAYCDWHFSLERGDRAAAFRDIPQECAHYLVKHSSRLDTWRAATDYAFVASPTGRGYDCHRTWEALVLGSIPIVSRSPIVDVFTGLPVVVVDSWDELDREWLESVRGDFAKRKFDWSRLFARHWVSQIHGDATWTLPEMTIDEFRSLQSHF